MNRAFRLAFGSPTHGLVREESKAMQIVLEIIKKNIKQESEKGRK